MLQLREDFVGIIDNSQIFTAKYDLPFHQTFPALLAGSQPIAVLDHQDSSNLAWSFPYSLGATISRPAVLVAHYSSTILL